MKANAEDGRILTETEKAVALAQVVASKKADVNALTTPWREHLFSQFHDILPGSCVAETREYAMAKSQELKAVCSTQKSHALKYIADNLDTEKYNYGMAGLLKAGVTLNRKSLSEIAIHDPEGFKTLVDIAKNA